MTAFRLLASLVVAFAVAGTESVLDPVRVRAQEDSGVDATVRANPLLVRIHVLSETVKSCGAIPVIVEIQNLADRPVSVFDESLLVQPLIMRTLAALRIHARVLRPKQSGLSIWILQPTQAGDVALVASVSGRVDGHVFSSDSAMKTLKVRSRCTRKGG